MIKIKERKQLIEGAKMSVIINIFEMARNINKHEVLRIQKNANLIEYWREQVKNHTIAYIEQREYNKRFTNKKYLSCGK